MKGRAIEAMVISDARFVVSVAVTFGMLLSGVFVQTAHAEKYSIQDIAAVGLGATVEGVNERGEIVGTVPVSPGATRFNGWWYKDGKMTDLNKCGGIGCRAMDINRAGQIVGNIGRDAYIHTHGKFINIAAFVRPPAMALALNDLAEIVGWYTLIPVPGENYPPEKHAFINKQGQIVGSANIAGHNREHAFLYTDGKMTDLGGLDGTEGVASCINNAGQIVGTSGSRGFLYSQGKMIDLSTLAPQESKWKSLTPRCINDRGQIAGIGVMADGLPHIFLMSPNP